MSHDEELLREIGKRLKDYEVTDHMRYSTATQKLSEVEMFLRKKNVPLFSNSIDLDKAVKKMGGQH